MVFLKIYYKVIIPIVLFGMAMLAVGGLHYFEVSQNTITILGVVFGHFAMMTCIFIYKTMPWRE